MFTIDLQVQIHVSDTKAPKVISMVATMLNLVNEVLQSAVGNHFRNTLQDLEAVRFIETRQEVQRAAFEAVREYLAAYEVETRGVYIQDVVFPEELVEVLTRREIANQERTTYMEQQRAETARIEVEKARGTADMQVELAAAQVSVEISANQARAREAEARGEAAYVRTTGRAEADRTEALGLAEARATEALGLAKAAGYDAQREAIGEVGHRPGGRRRRHRRGPDRHHARRPRHRRRRRRPRRPGRHADEHVPAGAAGAGCRPGRVSRSPSCRRRRRDLLSEGFCRPGLQNPS